MFEFGEKFPLLPPAFDRGASVGLFHEIVFLVQIAEMRALDFHRNGGKRGLFRKKNNERLLFILSFHFFA